MPSENDVQTVWQNQAIDRPFTAGELRERIEQMEKKMRRTTYAFTLGLVLVAAGIVAIAVLFANTVLVAGAVLSVCGLAFLGYEVLSHRRRQPAVHDGTATSLEYHRALLAHQLDFHRKRVWLRVLFLAPGGILFFLGLALARPDLAPLVYVELFTFAVGIVLIIPLNRRAAAKLERRIHDLERLQ